MNSSHASVGAVVVAAGSGERLGAAVPKALVQLAGRPLVAWAVEAVIAAGITQVVVTAPADHLAEMTAVVDAVATAVVGRGGACDVKVIAGGDTRSASVRLGVAALEPIPECIAIHDAARARQTPQVIRATVDAIVGDVLASAPGIPVVDTLKRVGADGTVRATVNRSDLWAVQTPQTFSTDVLLAVHAWAGGRDATDDLGLFEAAVAVGAVRGRAVLVDGCAEGNKITHPDDLRLAQALMERGGDA